MASVLLDAAGHRRSPATLSEYHRGRAPRNKGSGIRLIRQLSRRSSPLCGQLVTDPTALDCER